MVKSGQQADIRTLRYQAGGEPDGGVEASTFARLRTMPAGSRNPPVQRADFHVLAIIGSGHGTVTVDFVRHFLEPGTITWIRPGRVHRWDDIAEVDGTLVLFRPGRGDTREHGTGLRPASLDPPPVLSPWQKDLRRPGEDGVAGPLRWILNNGLGVRFPRGAPF
jgi:AraC family transcriptional activator of pobA